MTYLVKAAHTGLLRINGAAAAIMMMLVFSVVFTNAFWRYTAGKSIVWGEEVAVFAMVFGVMFGMAQAYLLEKHVRFSVWVDLLKGKWLTINLIVIDVLVMVVGFGLAVSGYEFLSKRGGITSPGTGLPMWVFQSATVIGGGMLFLSALVMLLRRVLNVSDEGRTS